MVVATTLPGLVDDELDVIESLVPLDGARVVELGCGAARLARALLDRHADAQVVGLDVDARQLAKNRAEPHPRLEFVEAGAQAIPREDASFDVAIMLKSLHHVPQAEMARALDEVRRVLRPRGLLYVSEPVYAGPLNEIVRLYNDEGAVRAAAQAALDAAVRAGGWSESATVRFDVPVHFRDYADFETRMMFPTFADHRIDDAMRARVRAAFAPSVGADGARFVRPMLVRLLRRAG